MLLGRLLEDFIADLWQYYDGTKEGYVDNYNNAKIIRKNEVIKGYAVNDKYPHLFASVDRLICEGGVNFITQEFLPKKAILEIKNMSAQTANMWLNGVPYYHIVQIQHYMIVYELDYAEIAILINGNELKVIPVERNEELCNKIIKATDNFWNNRILPARLAFSAKQEAGLRGDNGLLERAEAILQQLEPDPDNTEDYKEFMAERFRSDIESMQGDSDMFEKMRQDEILKEYIKELENERQLTGNTIRKLFVDNKVEKIDFGDNGYARYYTKSNAKAPTLDIRIKDKPSELFVKQQLNTLQKTY